MEIGSGVWISYKEAFSGLESGEDSVYLGFIRTGTPLTATF